MKRYIPSSRTSSNVVDTDALRTQFLSELTRDSQALMKQLSDQFSENLQTQAAQTLQGVLGGDSTSTSSTAAGSIGGFAQLFSTGIRYLTSRPRTTVDTQESGRSLDTQNQFKLSNAQQMAEAQLAMSRGDKNL